MWVALRLPSSARRFLTLSMPPMFRISFDVSGSPPPAGRNGSPRSSVGMAWSMAIEYSEACIGGGGSSPGANAFFPAACRNLPGTADLPNCSDADPSCHDQTLQVQHGRCVPLPGHTTTSSKLFVPSQNEYSLNGFRSSDISCLHPHELLAQP